MTASSPMTRSNLVLVGMPGSGKSTLGVLAAKQLGFDFVDTDLLYQTREGLKLHEILARDGAAGFLTGEDRLLAGLAVAKTMVSTGGSAVYHDAGMANLRRQGTVVWIDVPYPEIERRLGDLSTRGVVLGPGQTLKDLYDQRQPLYKKWADLRLEVGREDLETTVGRLVALFRQRV
jgi:shikimate kinase